MSNVQKLTLEEKKEIAILLKNAYEKYKSWDKVANRCELSESAVHLMSQLKYETKGDNAWLKVKSALQVSPADGWVIADTKNLRDATKVLQAAKSRSLWMPLSEKAGCGKSTASMLFYQSDKNGSVYLVKSRKWGKKDFLHAICRSLGLNPDQGSKSHDDLIAMVADLFISRRLSKPQLIIDQANSLKPAAITTLIHLYNECEGFLSCVLLGTENLEKTIKHGVKYNVDGFDELESRLGRNYIHLHGFTLQDTMKICDANGLSDKKIQQQIFEECKPVRKIVKDGDREQAIRFIEDCRHIKRKVERELLKRYN